MTGGGVDPVRIVLRGQDGQVVHAVAVGHRGLERGPEPGGRGKISSSVLRGHGAPPTNASTLYWSGRSGVCGDFGAEIRQLAHVSSHGRGARRGGLAQRVSAGRRVDLAVEPRHERGRGCPAVWTCHPRGGRGRRLAPGACVPPGKATTRLPAGTHGVPVGRFRGWHRYMSVSTS